MATAHESAELTLIEALSRVLPGDRLVVDPDVLAAISHDDQAVAGKPPAQRLDQGELGGFVRCCHSTTLGFSA